MIETISALKSEIDKAQDESCCNGETISGHPYRSSVSAYCEDLDMWFDIKEVEINRNGVSGGSWDYVVAAALKVLLNVGLL